MGIPNDPVTVNGEPAAYVIAIFARRRGPATIHKSGNLLPVLKRWESSAERVHLYAADAEGIFLIPPSGHSPAFCRRKQGFFAAILTQEGGDTQPRYDSSYHIFRENHVNRRRFFVMKRLTAMFLTLLLLLSLSACGTASQNQTDNTDSCLLYTSRCV